MAGRVMCKSLSPLVVQDKLGNALFGATVQIFQAGTRSYVTVYSSLTGSTTLRQPLRTDHEGQTPGYLDGMQAVDVSVNGGPVVQTQVPSGTPALSDLTDGLYWEGLINAGPGLGLVATAVKTGAYTAAPNDLVRVDATGGVVPITLPTPTGAAVIGVVLEAVGGGNSCIVSRSGTDVIEEASANTQLLLASPGEVVILTYILAQHAWRVLERTGAEAEAPNLELNMLDKRWGLPVDGVTDDVPAIQAVADRYHALGGGGGSTRMFFPMCFPDGTRVPYSFGSALTQHERMCLKGEVTYAEGTSVCTLFTALAGGNFSNGDQPQLFMVKPPGADDRNPDGTQSSGGQAPYYYLHGSRIEGIAFNPRAVPGLGAIRWWQPGEQSLIDDVIVNHCQPVLRNITDGVTTTTAGVTTLQSATAAFTRDDVNAPITGPSGTPFPVDTKIDRVLDATHATLNMVVANGSALHATIARPTDAILMVGGAATGRIGMINGIFNSGALLRLQDQGQGSWLIDAVSGDGNGVLIRISRAGPFADQMSITVMKIKAENYIGGDPTDDGSEVRQDPVVLVDDSVMLALNLLGGSVSGYNERDVVRIDPITSGNDLGGPSVFLAGFEGANPYNTGYANIIRDSLTGEKITSFPGAFSPGGRRMCPNIHWGRDVLLGGGARLPIAEKHRVSVPLFTTPDWSSAAGLWVDANAAGGIPYFHGLTWYNVAAALNDAGAWIADLDAGTWELTVLGCTETNQAIVSVDFATNVLLPPGDFGVQANTPTSPGYVTGSPNTPAGTYQTELTFVTQDGYETDPSPARSDTVDGTTQMQVNAPPAVGDAYGYNVYMTQAGGSTFTKQNASRLGLNDVYAVLGAPTSSGAAPPTDNGTIFWSAVAGTFDEYAAGSATPTLYVVPGIVIPAHTGPVLVRFRATGKNAASTAYYMSLSGMDFRRTA